MGALWVGASLRKYECGGLCHLLKVLFLFICLGISSIRTRD